MSCVAGESEATDPPPELPGQPFRLDSIIELLAPQGGQEVWQRYSAAAPATSGESGHPSQLKAQ
jgi:hypothetical protein